MLYWKSTCSTCRDARKVLQTAEIAFSELNYSKTTLTPADVERIVAAAGSVAAVLNTRHAIAKDKGWKATPPSKSDFVAAVIEEPNLLRRPVLLVGTQPRAIIGFDEAQYAALTK